MIPEILEDKTILQTDLIQVKRQKLLFPNKKKKIHYNVLRSPIVVIFPLTDKNELYLIHQYRYLYKKVLIEPIAGHVKEDESSVRAAIRELKEEAGMEAMQVEEFARLETSGSVVKSTVHFFLAKKLEMCAAEPEEDEDIEVFKVSFAEAVRMVMNGEIRNSPAVIGILMLDNMKREKRL